MSCTASTRKKEKGRYGSHRGYRFGIECMSIGTVAESEKNQTRSLSWQPQQQQQQQQQQ